VKKNAEQLTIVQRFWVWSLDHKNGSSLMDLHQFLREKKMLVYLISFMSPMNLPPLSISISEYSRFPVTRPVELI
jgi:hypothetical protein